MEAILATLKAIIDNFGSAIIVPFIIFIIARGQRVFYLFFARALCRTLERDFRTWF